MSGYIPNPTDPTQPTPDKIAYSMAAEFQALKGYIQGLVTSGTNFSYMGSMRNRLINSSFNISIRANNVTLTSGNIGFPCDRWLLFTNGGGLTAAVHPGLSIDGSSYIDLAFGAGITNAVLFQRIESQNCNTFSAGTPITVSGFYYVDNVAVGNPTVTFTIPTVKDIFTTTIGGGGATLNILPFAANTWMYFKTTINLAADAYNGLAVNFQFGATAATHNALFTKIQLEPGLIATPYEFRDFGLESEACRRYFQQIDLQMEYTPTALGQLCSATGPFATSMRIAPSVSRNTTGQANCSFVGAPRVTAYGYSDTVQCANIANAVTTWSLLCDAEL